MDEPQAKDFRFVKGFGDEAVILDEEHDVAHQLNAEAAAVWRACDGRSNIAVIAANSGVDPDRAREVLLQLQSRRLLVSTEPPGSLETRRRALRRMAVTGVGIVGLPAIVSVVLPTPAQAYASGSGGGNGAAGGNRPVGSTSGQQASSGGAREPTQTSGAPATNGVSAVTGNGTTGSRGHTGVRRAGQASPASPRSSATTGAGRGQGGGAAGSGLSTASQVRTTSGSSLPFTGFNVLSETLYGLAALAVGIGSKIVLRERFRKPE